MRKFILLLSVSLVLLLTGCSTNNDALQSVGLDGLTGKEILVGVANGSIDIDGYGLSVYDDELIVLIDSEKISVDMPDDEFYLSVAPYENSTHACLFHSATGCQGELVDESFYVEFIDENGNALLSKSMSTMENGFIDLWLPRDVDGTLTITYGDLSSTKNISTSSGEPTCETTMKLT